jgi:hypothetical protein
MLRRLTITVVGCAWFVWWLGASSGQWLSLDKPFETKAACVAYLQGKDSVYNQSGRCLPLGAKPEDYTIRPKDY